MEDKTNTQKDSHDVVLDLNFVPQWARKPAGENHYEAKSFSGGGRPPRRDDRRGARRDDRSADRPRRPRPDQRGERPVRRPEPREVIKELPEKDISLDGNLQIITNDNKIQAILGLSQIYKTEDIVELQEYYINYLNSIYTTNFRVALLKVDNLIKKQN